MKKYNISVHIRHDQPTDKCRNGLVEEAMAKNPDYLFWIDSDNLVSIGQLDILIKTLESNNADLVSGLYFGKLKPYYPVIREWKYGTFWDIDNVNLGEVIPIGGCGMGICLMKSEVFKKIPKPWYQHIYEWVDGELKWIQEDLFLCRTMQKLNMKLLCNTGVISAHVGSAVDDTEYTVFTEIREMHKQDRDEVIKDLKEFSPDKTDKEIHQSIASGYDLLRKEWTAKDPKTNEEVKNFYRHTDGYIFDLINWHFCNRRQFDLELVQLLGDNKEVKKVLDIGGGIAQNSIMLSRAGKEVTLGELDSKTLTFAEFRIRKHNDKVKVWNMDKFEMPPEEKYDAILVFDVLEHLTKEEMKVMAEKIEKLKHDKTIIMTTNTFGKTDLHPMHFNPDPEYSELVKKIMARK
jgi:2-polyprenyl-3-methyl-5-hydroxy-6-metoxy-1,4-benzoquinol methylase